MKHGAVVNPFGGHWDHEQGIRPEFRGDKGREAQRAAYWLLREIEARVERGYRRVFIHNLNGHKRGYSVAPIRPAFFAPDRLRFIRDALGVAARRHPGLTLEFHDSVRLTDTDAVATIDSAHPVPAIQHAQKTIDARIEGWMRIFDRFLDGGGKLAFSLDDGRKWPGVAMLIHNSAQMHGIEINVEPPMIDAASGANWRDGARVLGGLADEPWIGRILRDRVAVPDWAQTQRVWWWSRCTQRWGMSGLHNLLRMGWGVYHDSTDAEIDALLVGSSEKQDHAAKGGD